VAAAPIPYSKEPCEEGADSRGRFQINYSARDIPRHGNPQYKHRDVWTEQWRGDDAPVDGFVGECGEG